MKTRWSSDTEEHQEQAEVVAPRRVGAITARTGMGDDRTVYLVVALVIFVIAQLLAFFTFYRLVLRPLPGQINELVFRRHVENDFTDIAQDTADEVRLKLMQLESERLEAIVAYEALKGRRGLSETEKGQREALKRTGERLTKQIDGLRDQLDTLYAPDVLSHLRKFEELRVVVVLNRYLDGKESKR